MERRNFLRAAAVGVGTSVAFGFSVTREALAFPAKTGPSPYGTLQAADANGIMLPAGFTSRVIARSSQTVAGTSYTWHGGNRLYFSSQRGTSGSSSGGITYEVTGPFRTSLTTEPRPHRPGLHHARASGTHEP